MSTSSVFGATGAQIDETEFNPSRVKTFLTFLKLFFIMFFIFIFELRFRGKLRLHQTSSIKCLYK